ncbi:MAG: DegT/DnrJ/EryC1/StrS family aminotransferase, partial [Verrucomicrobia bacterium]|nr:DegT/DnrJ/EryC1/StrS family aminotransferase [Verrucomicrobiota bacterium]
SQYINDGEVTAQFEQAVANFIGCKHCVAVTSGTAAIALSLMALGIGPGDEVIVPDFTFIATANAVRLTGAEVKLVDIEPVRFTIDPNRIRSAIGPRTKAIIPVDVNGRGADYAAIESIAKECGLAVICDSAEALGSKYQGKYLGTYGDAGCFSFSANKTVSSGQGGMVATNKPEVYHRLKELKDHGRRFGGTGGNDLHPVMGYNFKYTNLQAAIALAQFGKIEKRLQHFQQRDQWYRTALEFCEGITLPLLHTDTGEVRQWTDLLCLDRSRLEELFHKEAIDCRPFWLPLHRQKPYLLPDVGFENTIQISAQGLWLPSFFDITKEDIHRVAAVIHQISQVAGVQ